MLAFFRSIFDVVKVLDYFDCELQDGDDAGSVAKPIHGAICSDAHGNWREYDASASDVF